MSILKEKQSQQEEKYTERKGRRNGEDKGRRERRGRREKAVLEGAKRRSPPSISDTCRIEDSVGGELMEKGRRQTEQYGKRLWHECAW